MATKDLRNRGSTVLEVPDLPRSLQSGTIHPFLSADKSFIHTASKEVHGILLEPESKRIFSLGAVNLVCTVILLLWCNSTNSMALTAYTYLTIFDIFSLLTCLLTIWVKKQKPTPIFSFGYERCEVLAVFSSTVLAMLGSLFIIKESVERMVEQPEIHTGRLLVGTAFAFLTHMVVSLSQRNAALDHVIGASSSSWLQEHVADMSEGLCHTLPGFSKLLLPRINPLVLIAFAGALAIVVVHILIDMNNYFAADTWAAVWIAIMTSGTMFPMSVYSGKILLQTTPSHVIGQLDKCLREASTLDGVLEFRNEHFWIVAFGTMAGSVHVRIRRDADEQMVLAHVANRLSNLVSVLTVQVFKDDWTRPSAYQILGDSSLGGAKSPVGSPLRFPLSAAPSPAASPRSALPGSPPAYQPIRALHPTGNPAGTFPRFPSGVGGTSGFAGATPTLGPGSFNMDPSFSSPLLGRQQQQQQNSNTTKIDPFSTTNFGTPLPDVLPTSMGIRSGYAPPPGGGSGRTVVGLPENASVRLGLSNAPAGAASGAAYNTKMS